MLILVGCLMSALHWRQLRREPFFFVNAVAIYLWGGCAFGWVPRVLLEAIPFINQIGSYLQGFFLPARHSSYTPKYLWV